MRPRRPNISATLPQPADVRRAQAAQADYDRRMSRRQAPSTPQWRPRQIGAQASPCAPGRAAPRRGPGTGPVASSGSARISRGAPAVAAGVGGVLGGVAAACWARSTIQRLAPWRWGPVGSLSAHHAATRLPRAAARLRPDRAGGEPGRPTQLDKTRAGRVRSSTVTPRGPGSTTATLRDRDESSSSTARNRAPNACAAAPTNRYVRFKAPKESARRAERLDGATDLANLSSSFPISHPFGAGPRQHVAARPA